MKTRKQFSNFHASAIVWVLCVCTFPVLFCSCFPISPLDTPITWTSVGVKNRIINALAVSETTVFAATDQGVFCSSDSGTTWKEANNGMGSQPPVVSLIENKGILLATTLLQGVFRSTNNGKSWLSMGLGNVGVLKAIVADTSFFAVGDYTGVFRSTDSGKSWSYLGLRDTNIISIWAENGIVIAGTRDSGMYRSTDNGLNWKPSNTGFTKNYPIWSFLKKNQILYAGTGKGVFRSRDQGFTWSQTDKGMTGSYTITSLIAVGDMIFAVAMASPVTNSKIFRSTDSGENWTVVQNLPECAAQAIIASGKTLFTGSNLCGIFRATLP